MREAFPDGIVWIGLGSSPDVVALQLNRLLRDGRTIGQKCAALIDNLHDCWLNPGETEAR